MVSFLLPVYQETAFTYSFNQFFKVLLQSLCLLCCLHSFPCFRLFVVHSRYFFLTFQLLSKQWIPHFLSAIKQTHMHSIHLGLYLLSLWRTNAILLSCYLLCMSNKVLYLRAKNLVSSAHIHETATGEIISL